MRDKTCCFTGHREILDKDMADLKNNLRKEIVKLIEKGVIYFGTGSARGFDTLAAEVVLEIKKDYQNIKLILIFPCANQTKGWNAHDKSKYNYIKSKADKIKVLSQTYYRGCMHTRNRHMVDHSGYCIYYYRKQSGGTAYTVDYALKNKVEVIYV